MYVITDYTYKKAKELNVVIKPSKNKNKKIDVFNDNTGKLIASIGAIGYKDYPTFIKEKGTHYANQRKELYKKRHHKDIHNKNSNGYWANKLLW
jgi:hypothetical protein